MMSSSIITGGEAVAAAGALTCVARPTAAVRRVFEAMSRQVRPELRIVLEDDGRNSPVDIMARLMKQAFEINQRPDGSVDMKDAAQYVLETMARNPKDGGFR